jgi:hypothetical protein
MHAYSAMKITDKCAATRITPRLEENEDGTTIGSIIAIPPVWYRSDSHSRFRSSTIAIETCDGRREVNNHIHLDSVKLTPLFRSEIRLLQIPFHGLENIVGLLQDNHLVDSPQKVF